MHARRERARKRDVDNQSPFAVLVFACAPMATPCNLLVVLLRQSAWHGG